MGTTARDAGHFARDHFAHNNFRGGFSYGNGWYGPVFWPHAYDDVLNDILWGYGLGGPFWDYGYGDIYAGVFSPLGQSDLAGAPPGELAQDTVSPPIGRIAENRQASPSSELSQMCGDGSREFANWPIDRIEQSAFPTAEQRTELDEFADATIQPAQTIKNACPIEIVFTPIGRLEAMHKRIEGMAQAVAIVGPPFERFFSSLTDEQKCASTRRTSKTSEPADRRQVVIWPATRRDGRPSRSKKQYSPVVSNRQSSTRSKWRSSPPRTI